MGINENRYENEKNQAEDSRPNKKNISVTMIFAVILAIGLAATGIWFSYGQNMRLIIS